MSPEDPWLASCATASLAVRRRSEKYSPWIIQAKPRAMPIEMRTAAELNAWLAAHHTQTESVWCVFYKKHRPHYLPWPDLVRTLLTWGWIDSQAKGVDADRTQRRISPRRPGSIWSAVNKRMIAELEASGELQPAGRAVVDRAKADGSWSMYDDVDALIVPADLDDALGAARAWWDAQSPSWRKHALWWVASAKRPATRAKRIVVLSDGARAGERRGVA
jgi:uncharacterized protein YdeI (YjbR/CyaY-like superfamily)